jgi:O-antigen ligase
MHFKKILILIFVHLLSAIVVLIYAKNNLTQELFGVWGRNNGFLTQFSYIILMTASVFYPIKKYLNSFIKISISLGIISLIYGILQYLKLVKIANINGENTQSSGFFGNENFYTALIGIVSVICLSIAMDRKLSKLSDFIPYLFPIFGLFGIHLANSQQGYLVFAVGSIIAMLCYIKTSKYTKILIPYVALSGATLFLIILGFFQIGPLTKYVYQETLTFRGYYCQAGIKMFSHNPILGLGFDSYRDYYRRFRSTDALNRLAPTDIADSAHNYFIDTAVNGGILLLLTYLLIIIYVIFCTVQIIRNMIKFDASKVAVIAAWYAFMTQSIISLPQLGLTIWGWIMSGLIIAIYKQMKLESTQSTERISINPPYFVISIFLVLGLAISVLPFKVSAEYRKAQEVQDIAILIHAAKMYPQDATMLAAAGGALIRINQFKAARELLNISINKYPQYYESWFIYSQLPTLTEKEKKLANKKMIELEPLLKNNSALSTNNVTK